jgi:hypothetical protein
MVEEWVYERPDFAASLQAIPQPETGLPSPLSHHLPCGSAVRIMRFLTLIEVLELHRRVVEQSGGVFGIRDIGAVLCQTDTQRSLKPPP